jgi:predicted nuclease with RNAse H fold
MRLKELLEDQGVRTVEMYPGASQDVWSIPRKNKGIDKLRSGLEGLGIEGLNEQMSEHELDAISGAYTGYLFLFGQAEIPGDFESGAIIIPKAPQLPVRLF